MNLRVAKLRQELSERELDAILISNAHNRRYLSGFVGTAGFLLVTPQEAILATDFRYLEQASAQAPDFKVHRIEGEVEKWLPGLAADVGVKRIAFEAEEVTFAGYRRLKDAIAEPTAELMPTVGVVEQLRALKDAAELGHIERAVALADAAYAHAASWMRPGVTEKQVAWELERFIRENGGDGVSFDLIVAAGPNGAKPHHHPTDRPIAPGEPVVMDLGALEGGYCSDLTRTVCLEPANSTFERVYDTVLGAQLIAIATVAAGMTGEQADNLARRVIAEAGHGENFGHGLGHGVGLAIHESPRLGKASSDVLKDGMVVTIEPGIYLTGWGGVRIEDMVVLENGRARVLTKAPKDSSLLSIR